MCSIMSTSMVGIACLNVLKGMHDCCSEALLQRLHARAALSSPSCTGYSRVSGLCRGSLCLLIWL